MHETLIKLRFEIAHDEKLGKKRFVLLACLNLCLEILNGDKSTQLIAMDVLNTMFWENL